MPKFIGISAIVGFFLSLIFLVVVSFFAIWLRAALFNCRQAQTNLSNHAVPCEDTVDALAVETEKLAAQIRSEKIKVRARESRPVLSNGHAWEVREKMFAFRQNEYPQALPRQRVTLAGIGYQDNERWDGMELPSLKAAPRQSGG